MLAIPALPLPGSWLLAHAFLFLAAAALVVGVALTGILAGQLIAFGVKRGLAYWRSE